MLLFQQRRKCLDDARADIYFSLKGSVSCLFTTSSKDAQSVDIIDMTAKNSAGTLGPATAGGTSCPACLRRGQLPTSQRWRPGSLIGSRHRDV